MNTMPTNSCAGAAAPPLPFDSARGAALLADIGGTNARFALERDGRIDSVSVLACADYASLSDAMRAYLSMPGVATQLGAAPLEAGLAIANPVHGDEVSMTNHHWRFSIEALRREFGFASLLLINDYRAMARSLPCLTQQDKRQVGKGMPGAGPIGLLGAGTGVGVSGLLRSGDEWVALDSEGGHVTFAPANERELDILRFAWKEYPHVSAERLMSGIGLDLVYRALAARTGEYAQALTVPDIIQRALASSCLLCVETVECFCEMLGTLAGNLAITLGATGGIYIGGGIVPRLGSFFDQSGFRRRFEEKGRLSGYLAPIPTYVITAPFPTFLGVSALLHGSRAARPS